jgi:hypothetical protein
MYLVERVATRSYPPLSPPRSLPVGVFRPVSSCSLRRVSEPVVAFAPMDDPGHANLVPHHSEHDPVVPNSEPKEIRVSLRPSQALDIGPAARGYSLQGGPHARSGPPRKSLVGLLGGAGKQNGTGHGRYTRRTQCFSFRRIAYCSSRNSEYSEAAIRRRSILSYVSPLRPISLSWSLVDGRSWMVVISTDVKHLLNYMNLYDANRPPKAETHSKNGSGSVGRFDCTRARCRSEWSGRSDPNLKKFESAPAHDPGASRGSGHTKGPSDP